MAVGIVCENGQ